MNRCAEHLLENNCIPRKHENIKTRNPVQPETVFASWCFLNFACQENIDFKTLFRYKKSLHQKERSLSKGFSGGFKQGKPAKALLELKGVFIS
jgi:hypothetical protein